MVRPPTHSSAKGLKPSADVDLRMRFAAVVTGAGGIGGFFRPPDDFQLRLTAVDDKPAHGMLRFFSTDFASIHCFNHIGLRLLFPCYSCMAPERLLQHLEVEWRLEQAVHGPHAFKRTLQSR